MRVLFLTHSFPRHPGDPAGAFILRLATALRAEDVDVRVVAPAAPGLAATERFDGVEVARFRYAPRRYERLAYTGNMAQEVMGSWRARLTMIGFLGSEFVSAVASRRQFQPDLVHAHWWFPGGLVGTWAATLADIPLLTTMHGSDVRLMRNAPRARPLLRHVIRKSSGVTTVSHWLAQELRALVPSARPTVAPMPVDTTLFTPPGAGEGSAGGPGAGERTADRLLVVGRLNAQKGITHLIAALAQMRTEAWLDVVGDGPDRAALEQQARAAGVAARITWHGALPQQALPALYRRAAALVVPSIDEGLGLVAVEAQLCATPVVASDSGGLPDVVRHGQTGILVPPANPAALAAALDDLLSRPDRGLALGQAARVHALGTFAPESAARRYAMLYRSVLADARTT